MPLQVKIEEPEKLYLYREKWNSLVLEMNRPCVFCTWEWMSLWWKHFGHKYKPLLLIMEQKNEVVGILPLAVRNMLPEDAIIPVRTVIFWGSTDLHTDHLDVIANKNYQMECIRMALDFLKYNYTDWDLAHFSHIDHDSYMYKVTHNQINDSFDCLRVSFAPYIDIAGIYQCSIENYLKSMNSKRRNEIKRRNRILINELNVQYDHPRNKNVKFNMERLFYLHYMRAKKNVTKTTFTGHKIFAFHLDIAETFSHNGWLWLRFLYKENEPVAVAYIFSFANQLVGYQMGFNPEWESKGIGFVLIFKTIEEAFNKGFSEYDFLRGGEDYKNKWTENSREQFNINIYNNTARGLMFKNFFRARLGLKKILGKGQN